MRLVGGERCKALCKSKRNFVFIKWYEELMTIFNQVCDENNILHDNNQLFEYLQYFYYFCGYT